MTKFLWLHDSYLREFDARVESVQGKLVVLDRTALYPEQGGQPCDNGTIKRKSDGSEFKVVFSKAFGETVSHEVDREGLKQGDEVHCIVDWERRYKLMRMHSSAHVIHNSIWKKFCVLVSGNQLGLEHSRMDFDLKEFDREKLAAIEKDANEIISKNLGITVDFVKREDALKKPELFRLKDKLPKALEEFRLVSIGNIDVSADGGTHVHNTGEIGKVKITKLDNKGASNRRIYWELE
jgi:misacylated tRNA(Ala) deacylase